MQNGPVPPGTLPSGALEYQAAEAEAAADCRKAGAQAPNPENVAMM